MCVCGLVLTDRRRGVEFGDLAGLKPLGLLTDIGLLTEGVD